MEPGDRRLPQERPRSGEAGEPKEIDLLPLAFFLRESIGPAVRAFGRKVSNYSPQGEDQPTNKGFVRGQTEFRKNLIQSMAPLETFVDLLERDRNALRVIPGWRGNEKGPEIRNFEVCFIQPYDVPKFNALVRRKPIKLTDSQGQAPLFILVVQFMEGAGLSTVARNFGLDPAKSLSKEEEERTRRIRIYTRRIKPDSTRRSRFKIENYSGVDVKEFTVPHDDDGKQYTVQYTFPNIAGQALRDLKAMDINVNRDSFDQALEFLKKTAEDIQ